MEWALLSSRNPCFSGQCFAIRFDSLLGYSFRCRNPCFSGQCFAMSNKRGDGMTNIVAILVLVDSVLQ